MISMDIYVLILFFWIFSCMVFDIGLDIFVVSELCQWWGSFQHSILQHTTSQHSTKQHNTVQYSTTQYNTVQYSTKQYNTVQYSTTHYSTVYTVHYMTFSVEKRCVLYWECLMAARPGWSDRPLYSHFLQLARLTAYWRHPRHLAWLHLSEICYTHINKI